MSLNFSSRHLKFSVDGAGYSLRTKVLCPLPLPDVRDTPKSSSILVIESSSVASPDMFKKLTITKHQNMSMSLKIASYVTGSHVRWNLRLTNQKFQLNRREWTLEIQSPATSCSLHRLHRPANENKYLGRAAVHNVFSLRSPYKSNYLFRSRQIGL